MKRKELEIRLAECEKQLRRFQTGQDIESDRVTSAEQRLLDRIAELEDANETLENELSEAIAVRDDRIDELESQLNAATAEGE